MSQEKKLLALILEGLSSGESSQMGAPEVLLGPGDDAALIDWKQFAQRSSGAGEILLKTDSTLEGVHFLKETPLDLVGQKAISRPISDLGAMGGIPRYALITVAAPNDWSEREWQLLAKGFRRGAAPFEVTVVGGEMTRAQGPCWISVSLVGTLPGRAVTRSGGQVGDFLAVTGKLGGSLQSGRHLTFSPRVAEGVFLAKEEGVHAMMDLSDGLGSDLPRLAEASHLNFELNPDLLPLHPEVTPQQAVSDGEDYELLVAIDPYQWEKIKANWEEQFPHLSLTIIGQLKEPGMISTNLKEGFDPF